MTTNVSAEIIGAEELKGFTNALPNRLFEDAKRILENAAVKAQKEVLDNSFNNGQSSLSDDKLYSRTGNLRRSIRIESHGSQLSNVGSSIYTNSLYAPLHEAGGTINAKDKYLGVPGGPYLNIPLKPNKTAAGVMRYSATEVFNMGSFIVKSRAGNWLVCLSGIKENKQTWNIDNILIPMFVLKKSVTVKARLGLVDAAYKQLEYLTTEFNNMSLE